MRAKLVHPHVHTVVITLLLAAAAGIVGCGTASLSAEESRQLSATPSHLEVSLVPGPEVVGVGPVTVSFGLPLPPGILTDPRYVSVRSEDDAEIPSFVVSLGSWRTLPPRALLCADLPPPREGSLRSVLVQFKHAFPSATPQRITIDLTRSRTLDSPAATPVHTTWMLARTGTYTDSDGILEPSVYPLLPPQWLACSSLTSMATVSGFHDNLRDFDAGQINFFPAVTNWFGQRARPGDTVDYRAGFEPWLFDRAQTFYNGYVRSGRYDFLREAHRAAQHYMKLLYRSGECPGLPDERCRGYFRLKDAPSRHYKDTKYSYAESLATLYWLTGDPEVPARVMDIVSATQALDVTRAWYPNPKAFTERGTANSLLAHVVAYEVIGKEEYRTYASRALATLKHMQQNPLEGHPPNGCFAHYAEGSTTLSFSPWMSSLFAHALLRSYHTLGDASVPKILTGLARCLQDRALYVPSEHKHLHELVPRYLSTAYGEPRSLDGDPWSDPEHAIDVAYVLALGMFFSEDSDERHALNQATHRLLNTHSYVLRSWTRPVASEPLGRAHLVRPTRKYAWWYKNTGAIGWVLDGPTRLTASPSR